MRVRTLKTFLGSLTILASGATPALATSTGGAAAGGSAPTTAPATITPTPSIHLSPITAKSTKLS